MGHVAANYQHQNLRFFKWNIQKISIYLKKKESGEPYVAYDNNL